MTSCTYDVYFWGSPSLSIATPTNVGSMDQSEGIEHDRDVAVLRHHNRSVVTPAVVIIIIRLGTVDTVTALLHAHELVSEPLRSGDKLGEIRAVGSSVHRLSGLEREVVEIPEDLYLAKVVPVIVGFQSDVEIQLTGSIYKQSYLARLMIYA